MLLVAEKHLRCLKAPALMREVSLGIRYMDVVRKEPTLNRLPPDTFGTSTEIPLVPPSFNCNCLDS